MSKAKKSNEYKAFLYDMNAAKLTTTGIYPAAHTTWHKDGTTTTVQRTEEQNGWNRHVMYSLDVQIMIEEFAESLTAEQRKMVSKLSEAGDLYIWFEPRVKDGETPKTKLSINCSDVFAWGCSDDEDITLEDIPKVYAYAFDKNGKHIQYGAAAYACLLRNEQPQHPVKEEMILSGAWNDQLAALPENYYDKRCAELDAEEAGIDNM